MKFEVIVSYMQDFTIEVNAKDEDAAYDKVQALIDKNPLLTIIEDNLGDFNYTHSDLEIIVNELYEETT